MSSNDKKIILQIENLKKYFVNNGSINKAVDNVTFNLREGEIVGLIGESGSGKTTVGRSLLRLYEDYNGFVTLENKIISGKKIPRDNRRFLRKNIQMIFQDPHAALNSQKNIYSILAEPLIVNNIIKEQIRDIYKDWYHVKSIFHYTFAKRVLELRLENLKMTNTLATQFFKEKAGQIKDYEYDEKISIDDNFSIIFDFLEEKQNIESDLINNLYSSVSNMMNFYFECVKKYRNKDLDVDESEFLKAGEEYLKVFKLTKMSKETFDAFKDIDALVEELKKLKKDKKELKILNKSIFDNYINEYKNEVKLNTISKNGSFNLEYWLYNWKHLLLNKQILEILKNAKSKFQHLEVKEIKNLVFEIESYKEEFFKKYFDVKLANSHIVKELQELVKNHFVFDISKYSILNTKNNLKIDEEIENIKKSILEKQIIAKNYLAPGATTEELIEKIKQLDIAQKNYNENMILFVEEERKIVEDLKNKIQEQDKKYELVLAEQIESYKLFDQAFKKFISSLNDKYNETKMIYQKAKKNKESEKELDKLKVKISDLKVLIKQYEEKVRQKLNTLKSFDYENKYLKKDIKTIMKLFGYSSQFSSFPVKKPNKLVHEFWTKSIFYNELKNLLIKIKIYKALEDVGLLKQFAYRYPHEFSGGQRQRIVIARALITEPKVIVADEPIASLDISIQAQVVNLLKQLCETKNIGMVFIAHDLNMIEYIADKVEIMHLGKIVESGKTETIYNNPIHPYTINLFKAIPKISTANEKFENVSFELSYLEEQRFPNIPNYYKVENNHYVYGTDKQILCWTKDRRDLPEPELIHLNKIDIDYKDSNLPYDGHQNIEKIGELQYTEMVQLSGEKTTEFSSFSFDNLEAQSEPKSTTRNKTKNKK